jgi:hypothetical protein
LNFTGGVNTGTIANEVHFHGQKSRTPALSTAGSIGADTIKRNYLKHLIDRYHDFAKAEKRQAYRYAVFYQAIKVRYGAKWDSIPLHLFENVCTYVQIRIDKTVLGRNRKAHGQVNYSSFIEYFEKYVNGERDS